MVSEGLKVESDCMKKRQRQTVNVRLYTETVGLFSVHHGSLTWTSDPDFSVMFR